MLQLRRISKIIGVHPGDQVAARFVPGKVGDRNEGSLARFPEDIDPRVATRVLFHDRKSGVVRAVIDEDQFEVGKGLGEAAFDCRADGPLGVAGGQDDGDGKGWRHAKEIDR